MSRTCYRERVVSPYIVSYLHTTRIGLATWGRVYTYLLHVIEARNG